MYRALWNGMQNVMTELWGGCARHLSQTSEARQKQEAFAQNQDDALRKQCETQKQQRPSMTYIEVGDEPFGFEQRCRSIGIELPPPKDSLPPPRPY